MKFCGVAYLAGGVSELVEQAFTRVFIHAALKAIVERVVHYMIECGLELRCVSRFDIGKELGDDSIDGGPVFDDGQLLYAVDLFPFRGLAELPYVLVAQMDHDLPGIVRAVEADLHGVDGILPVTAGELVEDGTGGVCEVALRGFGQGLELGFRTQGGEGVVLDLLDVGRGGFGKAVQRCVEPAGEGAGLLVPALSGGVHSSPHG